MSSFAQIPDTAVMIRGSLNDDKVHYMDVRDDGTVKMKKLLNTININMARLCCISCAVTLPALNLFCCNFILHLAFLRQSSSATAIMSGS